MFGIGPWTLIKFGILLYVLGIILKNGQLKSLGETLLIIGIAWYVLEWII
jgi:hypothetical protein